MQHPCNYFFWRVMTYCGNDIDIAIAVQRDGIDEQDGQAGEIVLAEPLGAGDGELLGHAILLRR